MCVKLVNNQKTARLTNIVLDKYDILPFLYRHFPVIADVDICSDCIEIVFLVYLRFLSLLLRRRRLHLEDASTLCSSLRFRERDNDNAFHQSTDDVKTAKKRETYRMGKG